MSINERAPMTIQFKHFSLPPSPSLSLPLPLSLFSLSLSHSLFLYHSLSVSLSFKVYTMSCWNSSLTYSHICPISRSHIQPFLFSLYTLTVLTLSVFYSYGQKTFSNRVITCSEQTFYILLNTVKKDWDSYLLPRKVPTTTKFKTFSTKTKGTKRQQNLIKQFAKCRFVRES